MRPVCCQLERTSEVETEANVQYGDYTLALVARDRNNHDPRNLDSLGLSSGREATL